MMGWMLFSVLLEISANHLPLSLAQNGKWKTCPFPLPKSIEPCTCRIDNALQVDIICNLDNDMDAEFIRKLTDTFGIKNDIRSFEIKLNNNSWLENFSADTIGKFRLSRLHISKFGNITGHFYPGAFHEKLEEITISQSNSVSGADVRINSGVFAHLPNLTKVSLTKAIGSIAPGAFFNLPGLQEIDLSKNRLRKIEEATFMNLPNLQKLDLSNNENLCHIGNMFSTLENPDMDVNLEATNVDMLLEEVFKPFVETVTKNKGKGKIKMKGVPLQCGCEAKWLHTTPYHGVFHEATCQDGTPLDQVDWTLHEMWCPPSSTPGYDAGYGQMYPLMLTSEDKGSVGEDRTKQSDFRKNYTISANKGPVQISFEYLKIGGRRNEGYLTLRDGDGTVILGNTRRGADVLNKNFTSNTNTVHVQFYSPYRECGRGCGTTPDKFKLNWQGKGGYVDADRNVFCQCCK